MGKGLIGIIVILFVAVSIFLGIYIHYKSSDDVSSSLKIKNKEKVVNVVDLGVIPNDGIDRTELLQSIFDKHRVILIPKGVYTITSGKYRNGDGAVWWGLRVPSNTTIHFEDGAILKFKDNMPSWSRVLAIYKAKNVRITGHVEIDGNCDSVENGNEHMANFFIESSKNVYVESVFSHDSYGDNIFIGGTEENPSINIKIDYFRGERAGRKNFVIHYVNDLYVKKAILDNSAGDSEKSWSGSNSIDLEPDNYTGKTHFYQRFDYVSTYGKGNDFTVGTSSLNAKNWILDIGTIDVHRMVSSNKDSEPVMLSYGLTAKIDKLNIYVPKGEDAIPIKLMYAARWNIKELTINGGNQYGVKMQYADNEKPSLVVMELKMKNVNGIGVKNEGGDVQIESFNASNVSGRVFQNNATSPNSFVKLNNLETYNSGKSEVIKVSSYKSNPVKMEIGTLKITDTRPAKVNQLIYLETEEAAEGLSIGTINNKDKIKEFSYRSGLGKKYKGM